MKPGFLVLINTPPGAHPIEPLELVLAGGVLEVDLDVLFCGPGREHLGPATRPPWMQIVDFDMGRLWYESLPEDDAEMPARMEPCLPLDQEAMRRLAADRRVLQL